MLALLLSPIGRFIAVAIIAFSAFTAWRYSIVRNAETRIRGEIQAAQNTTTNKKTSNALDAQDDVRRKLDGDPSSLRDADQYSRD